MADTSSDSDGEENEVTLLSSRLRELIVSKERQHKLDLISASEDTPVHAVLKIMSENQLKAIPVFSADGTFH